MPWSLFLWSSSHYPGHLLLSSQSSVFLVTDPNAPPPPHPQRVRRLRSPGGGACWSTSRALCEFYLSRRIWAKLYKLAGWYESADISWVNEMNWLVSASWYQQTRTSWLISTRSQLAGTGIPAEIPTSSLISGLIWASRYESTGISWRILPSCYESTCISWWMESASC